MRLRGYKFRLYPTQKQAILLRKHFGCSRFVWNWALEQKNAAYQSNNSVNCTSLIYKIPEIKTEFPWLREVNSQALQQSICNLDTAFVRFFRGISDFPRMKKKGASKASFVVPQHFEILPRSDRIVLPKFLEGIKTIFHRQPIGTAKSITISMSRSGRFFASILYEQDIDDPGLIVFRPETTIGIDMGLKSFLVTSGGLRVSPPKFFRKYESKMGFLDRQMKKKTRDSKRREKVRLRLARIHEHVANQRRDFLHKLSDQIANESQVGTICIENLNVAGMIKNHRLAKSIQDAGWAEFFRQLEYKCRWRGIRTIRIGRFRKSSRLCPCGEENSNLKLSDRTWTCKRCNVVHDRDLLAANNIRTFGMERARVLGAWVGNLEQRQDGPLKAKGVAGTHRFKRVRTTGTANLESVRTDEHHLS